MCINRFSSPKASLFSQQTVFMRSLSIVLFLLVCSFFVQAQFTDSTTHYVRFSAAGNLNRSSNATSYLLVNDARFSTRTKRFTFNTAANWLYGEQGAQLTNNDFTTTSDFNWYRDSSNLYYWTLANYTTSFSLKIKNQLQTGLGAAYNIANTANAWLNLSDGILYESSSLNTNNPANDQYHTFRNSLRLSYKFIIHKTVTFNGSNFLQQALGHADDYILRTNNSFGIKLNNWVSISTTISYNQFRRTGAENLLFTYGLVAEKFF